MIIDAAGARTRQDLVKPQAARSLRLAPESIRARPCACATLEDAGSAEKADYVLVTYWLVNSGQVGAPLSHAPGGVQASFREWESAQGAVHGLDRAYHIAPGDVLVHRSVGTTPSRLVAVGTVVAAPEATAVAQ